VAAPYGAPGLVMVTLMRFMVAGVICVVFIAFAFVVFVFGCWACVNIVADAGFKCSLCCRSV